MRKLVNGVLTKDLILNHHHQEIFHYPLLEFLKVWYVHNILYCWLCVMPICFYIWSAFHVYEISELLIECVKMCFVCWSMSHWFSILTCLASDLGYNVLHQIMLNEYNFIEISRILMFSLCGLLPICSWRSVVNCWSNLG